MSPPVALTSERQEDARTGLRLEWSGEWGGWCRFLQHWLLSGECAYPHASANQLQKKKNGKDTLTISLTN